MAPERFSIFYIVLAETFNAGRSQPNHEFVAWLRVRDVEDDAADDAADADAANPTAWLALVNELTQR